MQYFTLPPLVRSDSTGVPPDSTRLCQSPTRLHQTTGVWRSAVGLWRNPVECGGTVVGLRWDSGGTPVESSGKQGVGGCWVSLGLKFSPVVQPDINFGK